MDQVVALRLRNVSRRYGRHVALRRATVTFQTGETVLLLGPNGAGKTTLMKLVATLLPPTRGEIEALVQRPGDAKPTRWSWAEVAAQDRSCVGLVSHASLVYEDLTARENMIFFGSLYGLKDQDCQEACARLLTRVGLLDAADRVVGDFSRGMRQRLSIARSLIQNPSVVLLDEPFTGLDRDGCKLVYGIMRDLRARGCLTLLITHNLHLPPDLVDRVLLLQRGGIIADVSASSLDSIPHWYEDELQKTSTAAFV